VRAARALGRRLGGRYLELRYEDLVQDPQPAVRRICDHIGLAYEEGMLDYAGNVDVSAKPHQQRLRQPPTVGVRDWRDQMNRADALAFEGVAGDVLAELGYELLDSANAHPRAGGRLRLERYRAVSACWRAAAWALQRSPLWRRRHARLA
jgi:hypothetical protein